MNYRLKYGLRFRTVDESDAGFILQLRADPLLSKYLSSTSLSVDEQIKWIREYKEREKAGKEYYFMGLDANGNRLGVNRLYNFDMDSFEAGSWVYQRNLDIGIPIMGDLAARDFGYEDLKFDYGRFEVRKDNATVIKYHKAFNPELVGEDDLVYHFRLSKSSYNLHKAKLLKILNHG